MKAQRRFANLCLFLTLCASFLIDDIAHALVPPPPVVHAAIGAIAGSTGAIAAYPIDYVKSQLQTEEGRARYKGGFDAATDIVKSSPYGPLALYRGAYVNVIGVAPEKTVKLTANNFLRGLFIANLGYLPLQGEIISGMFAGLTQVIVTNPLEVVKVRMQTSSMTFKEVMKQMDSISHLYQGAGACIARDVAFSAILFPTYAHVKVILSTMLMAAFASGENSMMSAGTCSFWADLLAGSFAAAPAAFLSTPADVVKTRIQQARDIDDSDVSSIAAAVTREAISNKEDEDFFYVFSDIVSNEGPEVLFSGWFERVVRSVPQFGVTLAIFDVLTDYAINHAWLLPEVAK